MDYGSLGIEYRMNIYLDLELFIYPFIYLFFYNWTVSLKLSLHVAATSWLNAHNKYQATEIK